MLAVGVIVATGSLNHELYKWTGSDFVRTISAEDESMAAHQKMGVWPFILTLVVVYGLGDGVVASLTAILVGLAVYWTVIPMLFWAPQSIARDKNYNMLWFDILNFNIAVSLGYTVAVLSSWPVLPVKADAAVFLASVAVIYLSTGWSATYDCGV